MTPTGLELVAVTGLMRSYSTVHRSHYNTIENTLDALGRARAAQRATTSLRSALIGSRRNIGYIILCILGTGRCGDPVIWTQLCPSKVVLWEEFETLCLLLEGF